MFEEHGIETGHVLLQLEEEHIKEIGVVKVGHRLLLCEQLRELRRLAKAAVGGVDMESLLSQLVSIDRCTADLIVAMDTG